jgi:hypothetical protein
MVLERLLCTAGDVWWVSSDAAMNGLTSFVVLPITPRNIIVYLHLVFSRECLRPVGLTVCSMALRS